MHRNTDHCHHDATVIVNTYQQAPTLDLALYALAGQDFTGSWEIIVVDDGSNDDSARIVTGHADRALGPLVYVRLQDRGNRWSLARNLGIRLSKGRVLIFLDADMVPDRDAVRLHVEEQTREPALLAGNRLWRRADVDLAVDGTPQEQLKRLRYQEDSHDPVYRTRQAAENRLRHELMSSPHPWRAWFGCHVSLPTMPDLAFDETMLGWAPADLELGLRLYNERHLMVRYLEQARAWHIEREGVYHNPFRTLDPTAATEYVRQVCYMIRKHPSHDLDEVIDLGFDRLALRPDETWRAVPRGQGRSKRETLAIALAWYDRMQENARPCTP